ncbi:hypothetical protein GCM10007874_50460 [Labrys miyagiensis]|uniref:Transposase n=1 Tax=Labrys miyagiensis TaxID=346912 RepID=A0ABQ6CPE2_9HYPH|nr:hypothetical protein GCM10007874_50460 [Labrys miyagiensis]
MATLDGPPQTIREAIGMGWSGLRFDCPKCHSEGYEPFYKLERRGKAQWFIGQVYLRAACRKCNCPPQEVRLVAPVGLGSKQRWEERPIEILDGRVLRTTPGRSCQ